MPDDELFSDRPSPRALVDAVNFSGHEPGTIAVENALAGLVCSVHDRYERVTTRR